MDSVYGDLRLSEDEGRGPVVTAGCGTGHLPLPANRHSYPSSPVVASSSSKRCMPDLDSSGEDFHPASKSSRIGVDVDCVERDDSAFPPLLPPRPTPSASPATASLERPQPSSSRLPAFVPRLE
ncbi:hypothetical protein E2C01_012291 [Portunus trituberculatus]|uniref:Uncharacterized protein n=1 Tax=Portunus trituberculatus TaxID=210409 RepID=A0A5B7DDT1_PORTR|nr:hypothetical protein [Portunus trituberculatus]